MNTSEGKLIIFSAPSGAGKTTIVQHLLREFPQLAFSVSATTRAPRQGETDAKDYYFIDREEFLRRVSHQEFVEYEEVYSGVFYGTLLSELERLWGEGKQVLFDIDVEGGLHLKSKYPERALAIFVQPPSLEQLKERLAGRGTDSQQQLKVRLEKASAELAYAPRFDVVLVNDNLERACREAEQLVRNFIT